MCLADHTYGACSCTGTGGGNGGGAGGGAGGGGGSSAGKRIFITTTSYSANLGGIAGADNKCALAAMAGNLGGAWKAWISDGATNAIDRFTDVGPWKDLKGVTIFNNKANLATSPLAPLRCRSRNSRTVR